LNSRRKGKVGEREFAALLREHGFDARRGVQFAGGADSPDVVSEALRFLHIEVKRTQALNLVDACAQAEGDCGGKPWIVAHRRNHAPWLITMTAEFFFELLREFQPRIRTDTNFTDSHGGKTPEMEKTEGSEGREEGRGQASTFPPNDGGKDAVLTPRGNGGPEDYLGQGTGCGQ
jgi:hypothetical protein